MPPNPYLSKPAPHGFVWATDLEGSPIAHDDPIFEFFDADPGAVAKSNNIAQSTTDSGVAQNAGEGSTQSGRGLGTPEAPCRGLAYDQYPDLREVQNYVNDASIAPVQEQNRPGHQDHGDEWNPTPMPARGAPGHGQPYPVYQNTGGCQNAANQQLNGAVTPLPAEEHHGYDHDATPWNNPYLAAPVPGPGLERLHEMYGRLSHEQYDRTTTRLLDMSPAHAPAYAPPAARMQYPCNGVVNQQPDLKVNDVGPIDQWYAGSSFGHHATQQPMFDPAAYVRVEMQRHEHNQHNAQQPALASNHDAKADHFGNQAPNHHLTPDPATEDIPVTDDRPRGKLRLNEVGEGKCTFRSKQGNICNRHAPILEAVNGPYGRFCMCASKHLPQWRRSHALLPAIRLIPKTLAQAKAEVYPAHPPLGQEHLYRDPTLQSEAGQELKWQRRFLAAALAPYDGPNKKLQDQQAYFNGNVECDTEGHYSEDQVNSRIALLYHIARNVHVGGERLYAIFGDNDGYPKENRRLTFLRRLQTIEELLRTNKRIVLDVIQGRGVGAFVETPLAFDKRKATNNTNNENKKREAPADEEGEEDGENDETQDTPTPPPRKKRALRKPATQATVAKEVANTPAAAATVEHDPNEPPRHFYGTYVPSSSGSPTVQESSKETAQDAKLPVTADTTAPSAVQDPSAAKDGGLENAEGKQHPAAA